MKKNENSANKNFAFTKYEKQPLYVFDIAIS